MMTALPSICQLTPDDGEIQQAFVELDEKLAEWTAAMLDAQSSLNQHATATVVEDFTETAEVEETAYEEEVESTIVEEPPIERPAVAESIEIEADEASEEVVPSSNEPEEISNDIPEIRSAFGEKPRASDDVKSEPASEDEEKLLASLDPEAAKAIRIMRRLNPGKKSVKELLAEYEAAPASSSNEQSKKKSWWTRKKA
jgi:hypothetical protein